MKSFLTLVWMCVLTTVAFAQNNYQIQPGDRLQIEVLEDPSLNRTVVVLPDGRFSFPFAGTVQAGGRSLGDVERGLASAIASNFALDPNVFISVAALQERAAPVAVGPTAAATISVFFLGEVSSPGEKALEPGTSFLQSLAASGGFTNFAALKRVQVRRTDPSTGRQRLYTINYKALSNGAQLSNDLVLRDGDVVLVPERRLFE